MEEMKDQILKIIEASQIEFMGSNEANLHAAEMIAAMFQEKIIIKGKRVQYVFKRAYLKTSNQKMADLMYAVIMTQSQIRSVLNMGITQYTRKQNSYNGCYLMLKIPECNLNMFSEISGIILMEPEKISPFLTTNTVAGAENDGSKKD